MKQMIKGTFAASLAIVTASFAAHSASAQDYQPDAAQGSWYFAQSADGAEEPTTEYQETDDRERGQDAQRRDRTERGSGKWRGRKHARGQGRRGRRGRRYYQMDLTKAQFFDQHQQRFQSIDVDGNGVIEQTDIDTYIEQRRASRQEDGESRGWGRGRRYSGRRGGRRMARMMGRMDQDADGRVTTEEFMQHADRRFARLDNNGDGRLNQTDIR